MTAGFVVILGKVGRNLASGMTGGVLFVLGAQNEQLHMGPHDVQAALCEKGDHHADELHRLIEKHAALTGSPQAARILADWPNAASRFWKLCMCREAAAIR
jgi:glutamate synthase (NADPH/NADH) large chain